MDVEPGREGLPTTCAVGMDKNHGLAVTANDRKAGMTLADLAALVSLASNYGYTPDTPVKALCGLRSQIKELRVGGGKL